MKFYPAYKITEVFQEYIISFYRMLDEAMIIDLEDQYRETHFISLSRAEPKYIKQALAELRSQINLKTTLPGELALRGHDPIDVVKDRERLKQTLKGRLMGF